MPIGMLRQAEEPGGFDTVLLDGSARFPIADKAFDVVFCSSVIEHVTAPREVIPTPRRAQFAGARGAGLPPLPRCGASANAISCRPPTNISCSNLAQLPPFFVVLLPRRWQVRLIGFAGRHGLKAVQPDFRLRTIKEMRALFPDAEIVLERYCGFVKSIVAIKT